MRRRKSWVFIECLMKNSVAVSMKTASSVLQRAQRIPTTGSDRPRSDGRRIVAAYRSKRSERCWTGFPVSRPGDRISQCCYPRANPRPDTVCTAGTLHNHENDPETLLAVRAPRGCVRPQPVCSRCPRERFPSSRRLEHPDLCESARTPLAEVECCAAFAGPRRPGRRRDDPGASGRDTMCHGWMLEFDGTRTARARA